MKEKKRKEIWMNYLNLIWEFREEKKGNTVFSFGSLERKEEKGYYKKSFYKSTLGYYLLFILMFTNAHDLATS